MRCGSGSIFSEIAAGSSKTIKAMASVFAFACVALLAPAMASAETPSPKADFPSIQLESHHQGEAAIRALGLKLPDVAKWYQKSAQEFEAILRRDSNARIDRAGRLYYVEKTAQPLQPTLAATTVANGPYPADQTFLLHSRPGAQRVIYLDFNGHTATGTAWNDSYGLSSVNATAFDLDGAPTTFSTTETDLIQYIYQRVAEDFAAFDVDVTTEEPSADALSRSSTSDATFGTRVVVAADWTASTSSPCGCGGFAYLGIFDDTTDYYKPAFVFYTSLGNGNEKYVAEAISHEAGHNLGLNHDGATAGVEYYAGHGSGVTGWAPIMGVGYYKDLVQWSKGEYPSANNAEDDIALAQSFGAPLRPDDHGNTTATATALTALVSSGVMTLSGSGTIDTRGDVDMFSFNSGAGTITLNINPGARGPNLDASAELLDANGILLASANLVDVLNASIVMNNANVGTYYLKVDGVGKGDLTTGYSDYGSLGLYTVSGSVPAAASQPPVAIASATPSSGTTPLTVSFSSAGSYDPDGTALTYSWDFGDGSAQSTEANPSHVYTAGDYTATLTVSDASGATAVTLLLISVNAGTTPALHVETISMKLSLKSASARATATITITDASGKALNGVTVTGSWSGVVSGTGTATTSTKGARFVSPTTTTRGTLTFTVTGATLSGYIYNAAQNKQSSASIVY